ncbi:MAG TPA: hypothetical protein IAD02_00480 [Candidatus Enterousia intestinigallinarum]|uniref:Uncharacterized protein n=1 Tax=Candidatus Enterousia intestinigallinarum TaxID=2840790 RepID=A0A9D1JVQ2_9PROT|nr:hypothetical protein [Candidatus Enterousia intestinigallinarum]
MPRKKKEVEVIDQGGAKTVKKKKSFVTRIKIIFAVVSLIWIALVIAAPLYVKNTYSQPIKKSIVVSMFFDLQRNIVEQYEKLLDGIKDAINLEKPVAFAVDKVRMVEDAVDVVTDTTDKAKDVTAQASDTTAKVTETTEKVGKLSGLANMFGIDTSGVDKALGEVNKGVDQVNEGIDKANDTIAKVDNTAALVNEKLDEIETQLTSVLQVQIDDMIDDVIKTQLDKSTGGLGTTLLTNYGIEHVYPWRPSSWPVATKIYDDLAASDVQVITVITDTVDQYFGYVAWGLVIAVWLLGLLIWISIFKKTKAVISPFIVCPRCGHTFTDKRTAYSLLKVVQPWKWL